MEITFELLDSLGFERFNEHFTYRCFPAPLFGSWRIDREGNEWKIEAYGRVYIRTVKTINQVNNFYHGMTDTWLFSPLLTNNKEQ